MKLNIKNNNKIKKNFNYYIKLLFNKEKKFYN